jgi:sugar phosphate isomerase/epimerase
MTSSFDRRRFLKASTALAGGVAFGGFPLRRIAAAESAKATPHATKLGWRVTCAAYTFNRLTFHETLQQVVDLGLNAVEGFEWQTLSGEHGEVQTNAGMPAAVRKELAQHLAGRGVSMVGLYCRNLDTEAAARPVFQFAKDMGVEYLVAEPSFEAYDMLAELCPEYRLKLAVHNHPAPSRYFDPATTLKVVRDRGPWIGACCDTGHWVRSGFQPVEALKRLEGHIVSFHLKDVDRFGEESAVCVPWGTGAGDIGGILKEMHRQQWQGDFGIEYEPYRPDNAEKAARCIAYLEKIAGELAA